MFARFRSRHFNLALLFAVPVRPRRSGLVRSAAAKWSAIVVASALVTAPSALAATPFTLSPAGEKPGIAVDATGGAHVAFNDITTTLPERTGYCRVPRGVIGCLELQSLGPEADDADFLFGRAQVFERGGTVDVLTYRCCGPDRVLLKRSTNLGLSFGARQLLATGASTAALDDATRGPDNFYSWVDDGNAAFPADAAFQSAVPGSPAPTAANLNTTGRAEGATVGLHGNVPVVVSKYSASSDGSGAVSFVWRKYVDGSGSRNDVANWTARQPVAAGIIRPSEARLAEGPSGLFLASVEGPLGDERVAVRKFTGDGFGAATLVSSEEGDEIDLHQDPSGRLHAVWRARQYPGNGADPIVVLRWRTSTDGVNWGPVHTLNAGENHADTRVAAAADGTGFAVWTNSQGVRMVPLEPLPEPIVVVEDEPRIDPPVRPPARLPDRTAPAISGLSVSKSKLKPGQAITFRFGASEPGSARLLIDRKASGLKMKATAKSKMKCLVKTDKRLSGLRKQLAKRGDVKRLSGKKRTRKLRALVKARGCSTRQTLATLTRSVVAGANQIVFSGKVKGRALKSGGYRAVLTVTDAAGNVSSPKTITFKVLPKQKAKKKRK